MKRIFADLHLRLNPRDTAGTSRILTKVAALGYSLVSVPIPIDMRAEEETSMKRICSETGVDFSSRVDLQAKTRDQLMHQLRKLRRRYEVVCVLCENKEVARQAAKDRRVDLLNFPSLDYTKRFFDNAEAELASKSIAGIELDLKPLLLLEGPARIRLLSTMRREVSIAKEFRIPVILSSGVASELLLRRPREVAALAGLIGLDEASALETVSANPCAIVKRNREKLGAGFVAPGIRVVKGGVDC